MARSLILVMGTLLALSLAAGALLFISSDPSTKALDADLADIRAQISVADEEVKRYSGGLIRAIVDVRKNILLSTEAMLVQKRASVLRRIDMRFTVAGAILAPAPPKKLAEITSDIEKAKAKLVEDSKTASQYTGGLLQAMSLMNVEVDRLTISQLELSYYGAKYGLSVPMKIELPNPTLKGDRTPNQNPPGLVVKDKEAL